MKARRFYPRAEPYEVAELLRDLAATLESAGWDQRGGHLLRDCDGNVTGRTCWIPRSQWWAERPHSFSERQTAGIVLKHIKAERPLTARELHCLRDVLRVAGVLPESESNNTQATRETAHDERIDETIPF
jgi:hypothetical protein